MNRCRFLSKLNIYLDNQLPEKERLRLEQHIKSCKVCALELGRLRSLSQKLHSWQAPVLGEGFDSSVRNKIVSWELERGQVKMKKKTIAILVPSGVLVAILMFLFVGTFFNVHLKRGLQGRLGDATDSSIGEQFGMGYSGSQEMRSSASGPYEPYYLESTFDSNRELGRSSASYSYTRDATSAPLSKSSGEAGYRTVQHIAQAPGEGPVIVIQPSLPATGKGDLIIRTAVVKLEVENGKLTYNKATEICQELGGYMARSNFYKDREGREAGTLIMRIPKEKFTIALERLGALGKVENINSDSQDVKQQYANLKAELDAAMVVYNKMVEALQKRQVTIPEAVRLESELTPVLRKIEGLKNQMETLDNAVSFTTITVNFHEPKVSAKALADSGRVIKESLITTAITAVKFVAGAVPVLIVVIICAAILLVSALVIKYLLIRFFKRG